MGNAVAWGLARAFGVIVTNSSAAKHLDGICQRCFILPDMIPVIPERVNPPDPAQPEIVVIASFHDDEPIALILEAVCDLDVTVRITGRKDRAGDLLRYQSPNIIFTGFLTDKDYDNLIAGAALLIDLTTDPACLVCGAYEAAAVGVPCVISDSLVNRETFSRGYVYVALDAQSVRTGIETALADIEMLRRAIVQFRHEFEKRHRILIHQINESLS